MASMFDSLQKSVFNTAETVFGHTATWTPSTGGVQLQATVLFNNPTEQMTQAGIDYDPTAWKMEYYVDQLLGLKALVDTRSTSEVVSINGKNFFVSKMDTKYDGKTYIAVLVPQ